MFKSKTLKVGFVCDLHLDNNPFDAKIVSNADMLERYTNTLHTLLMNFHRRKCDLIVFAGDTWDTPHPSNESIAMLIRALSRFPNFKYAFFLGNHEIESNVTHALKTMAAVALISKIDIEVVEVGQRTREYNGFPVRFMSYPDTDPYEDEHPGLIVMHNEFYGAKRDNGSTFEKGAIFDSAEAEETNRLYVSGHLHTYQAMGKEIPGTGEVGVRRMTSGRIYFGRVGSMRHDGGEFNKAGTVTMRKLKGRYVYDVETFTQEPDWIIQSKRYGSQDEFLDHIDFIEELAVPGHVISIRVKADSKYIPTETELDKYPYLSIEKAKSAYEELQDEMKGERQTKDLTNYMDNWLDNLSTTRLKGFALDQFNRLRQKMGS